MEMANPACSRCVVPVPLFLCDRRFRAPQCHPETQIIRGDRASAYFRPNSINNPSFARTSIRLRGANGGCALLGSVDLRVLLTYSDTRPTAGPKRETFGNFVRCSASSEATQISQKFLRQPDPHKCRIKFREFLVRGR